MSGAEFGPGDRVAVMVPMPLPGALDYLVPGEMALATGDFVEVPVGGRLVTGAVWGPGEGRFAASKLKHVARRLAVPGLSAAMRRFLDRAADYTLTPPGMMLRLVTRVPDLGAPPPMRHVWRLAPVPPPRMTPARSRVLDALLAEPEGLATGALAEAAGVSPGVITGLAEAGCIARHAEPADAPWPPLFGQAPGGHLSEAQAAVAAMLRKDVAARAFRPVLLRGVTGSGKTEVYLEAVAEAVAAGRQALVMVPEVALTPGFLSRVEARFGARPAEWHHGVPAAERRRVWHGIASGEAKLVVGARSALFLPFRELGLIVVDEEHEAAFKQEEVVLYNARDMAVLRAAIEGAAVVLASATPSLESWANAASGKYARLDLPDRFGPAAMPRVSTVDLRVERPAKGRWLSPRLVQGVAARLQAGEQALLFINRRGYAPVTQCFGCGHIIGCPHCDTRLVEHRLRGRLVCHQCGHEQPLATRCPSCDRDDRLSVLGPGVERLAEEAALLFPQARITVLSSDLAGGSEAVKDRLAAIAAGEVDLVIGTQMVAKGHNFPRLTLVGVVDADLALHGGDLRAAERTFQLIHQVAGRAGRAELPGQALIQTALPDHPVMRALVSGEAEDFWAAEAAEREAAGAPPYGRMAGIIVTGPDEAAVFEVARALARAAEPLERIGAELFGPAPAPIARIRGRARVRLLVKAAKGVAIQPALRDWLARVKPPGQVRVIVDIDPQSFF